MAAIEWNNPEYSLNDFDSVKALIIDLDQKLKDVGLIEETGSNKLVFSDWLTMPSYNDIRTVITGSGYGQYYSLGSLYYRLPRGNGKVLFTDDETHPKFKRVLRSSYDNTPVYIKIDISIQKVTGLTLNATDIDTAKNYHKYFVFTPKITISKIKDSSVNVPIISTGYYGTSGTAAYTTPVFKNTKSYVNLNNESFTLLWCNAIQSNVSPYNSVYNNLIYISLMRRNGNVNILGNMLSDAVTTASPHYYYTLNDSVVYNSISNINSNINYLWKYNGVVPDILEGEIQIQPVYSYVKGDSYMNPYILICKVNPVEVTTDNRMLINYKGEKVLFNYINTGDYNKMMKPFNDLTFSYMFMFDNYECTTEEL